MSNLTEQKIETMTPDEVCTELRNLGVRTSPTRVRTAIKNGQYPFGICISMDRDEFEIYKSLFNQWVNERAN